MTTYEIPLTSQPTTFNTTIAGTTYQMTLQWRDAGGVGWVIDIADASGNRIVSGIPLVTGCDLLAQYGYLGIGAQMFVGTDGAPLTPPTFTNLGTATNGPVAHLYVAY